MNTKQYEMWIENHQTETGGFDITDAVMRRIAQKRRRQSVLDKVRQWYLLNLLQAKALVRVCVLVSGAMAGLLRMTFVVYYALFA